MGIDPAPYRSPYVIRILELFAAMPFHAFFGVAVMMSSALITTTFAHPPAAWGVNPSSDQSTGGALAWAFGELPTLVVLLILFLQWSKSDEREARRTDRKADRDGDSELADYNAYLAGLAAHDNRAVPYNNAAPYTNAVSYENTAPYTNTASADGPVTPTA
jgi:cytochrome c oxidase assembly factor CtaG